MLLKDLIGMVWFDNEFQYFLSIFHELDVRIIAKQVDHSLKAMMTRVMTILARPLEILDIDNEKYHCINRNSCSNKSNSNIYLRLNRMKSRDRSILSKMSIVSSSINLLEKKKKNGNDIQIKSIFSFWHFEKMTVLKLEPYVFCLFTHHLIKTSTHADCLHTTYAIPYRLQLVNSREENHRKEKSKETRWIEPIR